jgi:hypothetical protein
MNGKHHHADASKNPSKPNQTGRATKATPECPRIAKPQTSAKQKTKTRCESEYANQITNGLRHPLPGYAMRLHSVYD